MKRIAFAKAKSVTSLYFEMVFGKSLVNVLNEGILIMAMR